MSVTPVSQDASDRRSSPERVPAVIGKAAVLGAGTMGSRIAAHLANAGLPVVLLDIASEGPARSRIAEQALDALKKSKPAAFFDPALASHIKPGNFADDMHLIADCDWVIEAVTEDLRIKQGLLEKALPHLKEGAIFTTNTSGLPVATIAANAPESVRRRWFGTHFFNPPRYMRLVEIIPTPETDPAAIDAVSHFADLRLGKDVVFARDTPNFIANRIGVFVMLEAARLMQAGGLTIEEVDALTGSALGWPRTGTFRLSDLVGLDVLAHVARNFPRATAADEERMALPSFMTAMLERRWLGDKTKQGFYKKDRDGDGKELRLALDWKTLDYRIAAKPSFPTLDMAKSSERLSERLPLLVSGDPRKDKGAWFQWKLLIALWNYAADCLPEIANDVASVDRAMRAGFNWEMGPFQMWDAAGVPGTIKRMEADGEPVSETARLLIASGAQSWYGKDAEPFNVAVRGYQPVQAREGVARIADYRAKRGVVTHNPGASLIDLGGGVGCIELHSKKNAIGEDVFRLITEVLQPDGAAVREFEAFVISGDADNFSVGANLMQLLLAIQEEEWDDVDGFVRHFQRMTSLVKFCPRPVVVAPFGFCLGGGAELALHATRRQTYSELYMGLVETGVGIVPAGGGCKEMVLRAVDAAAVVRDRAESVELVDVMRHTFETIAMAKVSTSAVEARKMTLLSAADQITMNRDRLLGDAKELARSIASGGYAAPVPRTDIPAPGSNILASLKLGVHIMREAEYISDHDVKIANRVAYILCGGDVTPGTPISEQYLLDLEREAFLSLCGEKKTQERIAYTLKHGKPLRN